MPLLPVVAVALGAGAAVALTPVALGAVGFSAAGIAANSIAAGMMSSAALANGGAVAAGSTVAVMQSARVIGLSTAMTATVAGVGGAIGWLVALI